MDVKFREKGVVKLPPALSEYVALRSQGHPLMVEELVRVVLEEARSAGLVMPDPAPGATRSPKGP